MYLLRFQLSIPRPPLQYVDISTRSWKGFKADRFRDDLLSSTLCQPDSYTDLSVDQLQEMYDTTLPLLLDKHAPLQTVRKRYQPLTPWFDAECATSRRKSRLFERRYRSTKSAADRLAWTNQVRRMHHLYDRKQNSYWEAKVNDSKEDPKKL